VCGVLLAALVAACGPRPLLREERIVFSSNRGADRTRHLWSIQPSGAPSSLRQVTSADGDTDARVSPDGTLVAFARFTQPGSSYASIWIRSLVTGVETRITDDAAFGDGTPFWHPGGQVLGFARGAVEPKTGGSGPGALWAVRLVRAGDGVRAGHPARISAMHAIVGDWNPVTGADLLAMRQEPSGWAPYSIVRQPYPAGEPTVVRPYDGRGQYYPAYSPDGLRVAYLVYRREVDLGELHVAQADGSGVTLAACEHGWGPPAWSPDGTELVAARTTAPGLWRFQVPTPGGACGAGAQITRGAYLDAAPTWASVVVR
jgi:dipeptidyl aminopeptidase/acylaminoacyl peptidase